MGDKGIVIKESDYGVVYMLQKHGREFTTQSIHIDSQIDFICNRYLVKNTLRKDGVFISSY
jgi:hypothetical protein